MPQARISRRIWILAILVVLLTAGLTGCDIIGKILGGAIGGGSEVLTASPPFANLKVGQDLNLTITSKDAFGNTQAFTVFMEDETIATARAFGNLVMLRGVKEGSTTLYIAGGSKTLQILVTVGSSSGGTGDLTVSKTDLTLLPGDTQVITVTSATQFGASASNGLVTVNYGQGYVVITAGQTVGSSMVTLTSFGGGSATINVTISNTVTPASLNLTPTSLSLNAGETKTVTVDAIAQGGAQDAYSVSSSPYVTTTISGTTLSVYGKAAGTVNLTITTTGGLSASLPVTINAVANQIPAPFINQPYVDTATGSVSLYWNQVAGATGGYDIERAKKADLLYSPVGSTPSASYNFTDMPPARDLSYMYRIRGKAGATNLGIWAEIEVYVPAAGSTAPTMPPNFSMQPWATSSTVYLDWDPVPLTTYYEIEKTNPDGTVVPTLLIANTNSYTDSANILPGKTYGYRVRGSNGSPGPWSAKQTVLTQSVVTTLLPAPTLTLGADYYYVALTWTYVSGANTYVIQRFNPATNSWDPMATMPSAPPFNWTDYSVSADSFYKYRVAGVDQNNVTGNFGLSQVQTPKDPTKTPPSMPFIYSSYASSSTSVYTSWYEPTAFDYDYGLSDSYANSMGDIFLVGQSATYFTSSFKEFLGLTAGQSYFFKVRARNMNGWGPWTSPVQIDTPFVMLAPSAPTNVQASNLKYSASLLKNYVEISWIAGSYASGYTIQRAQVTGAVPGTYVDLLSNSPDTLYQDSSIIAGQSYAYRVVSVNSVGSATSLEIFYTAPDTANVSLKLN